MSNLTIADGHVVVLNYTLRSDKGEVIDFTDPGEPMAYLHGAENIVPGLEKALTGKAVGFKATVKVEPADAYGERADEPPRVVRRSAFPPDVELEVGAQFMAEGPKGEEIPIWVIGLEDDKVVVDAQHPLAGETLHFDVEVLTVREATSDELSHGHPHGPDGHEHEHEHEHLH